MTTLQGLTVAIAPSGVQYFAQTQLVPALAHAVATLQPPNNTVPVPDILLWASEYSSESAKNITITLSSGQLNGFVPAYQSLTQNDGGQFTLVMNAPAFSCSFNWNEQYDDVSEAPFTSSTTPVNSNFAYTVGFSGMTLKVVFTFAYVGTSWQLTFNSATPAAGTPTPNIPSTSIVNNQDPGCFTTSVGDATKAAVDTIDFTGVIKTAISPLFTAIPATGQITKDITFDFGEGPAGLTFPNDAGVVAGVTGVAGINGKAFSGGTAPSLPTPSVPTDKHLSYDVSDYTLNSLMWAFYTEGSLHQTVAPGDLPDASVLNTANYDNTPLQALYDAYPNLAMTAAISATAAPTVTFEQIYALNDGSYASLQSQLPPDVYTKLATIKHQAFLDEAGFSTALSNDIGATAAGQYKTIIEAAAQTYAAVVTEAQRVVLNVVQAGTPVPVITFDVAQTDVLQSLQLGISGAAQSLTFDFQMVPHQTKTTFVSSTVAGIDATDFTFIWNMALGPAYADTMGKIGKAGVALPRIPGFDFLFDEAVVTTMAGYINVVTDVQHTSDAAMTLRLASKLVAAAT